MPIVNPRVRLGPRPTTISPTIVSISIRQSTEVDSLSPQGNLGSTDAWQLIKAEVTLPKPTSLSQVSCLSVGMFVCCHMCV